MDLKVSIKNTTPLRGRIMKSSSGGAGTDNYNDLRNKPRINGVPLVGNKTSEELGIPDLTTQKRLFRARDYSVRGLALNGGFDVGPTNRVTTLKCLQIPQNAVMRVAAGVQFRLAEYTDIFGNSDYFVQFLNSWTSSEISLAGYAGKYVRILARYSDSSDVSDPSVFADLVNIEYETTKPTEKPLENMFLSVLGDSISAYRGYVPSGYHYWYDGTNYGVSSVDEMWWSVLCEKTGLSPVVINAYSGAGVTQLEDSGHSAIPPMSGTDRTLHPALGSSYCLPDVIIIAGGLNDYTYAQSAQSEPLEWDGKTTVSDLVSFTQQYALMLRRIMSSYKNSIIICLSTFFSLRGTFNGTTYTHSVGNNVYTQSDYDAAIESVCKKMDVPFIDIGSVGFNRFNYYPMYAVDSEATPTHPNAAGHQVIGEYLADNIVRIVRAYLGS